MLPGWSADNLVRPAFRGKLRAVHNDPFAPPWRAVHRRFSTTVFGAVPRKAVLKHPHSRRSAASHAAAVGAEGVTHLPPKSGSGSPEWFRKEQVASQVATFCYSARVKIVGTRRRRDEAEGIQPEEALRRAALLQAQADRLNPYPRPRGFVFRARTWEAYEAWRRVQTNPRLW